MQCVCFKKKYCFDLVVLNRFPICFCQGLFTRCDLYHRILLCYYFETREMIGEFESSFVRAKTNSFSLQSITTPTGFANICPIFYKVHSPSSKLNRIENLFRVRCIGLVGERVIILRGFLSTI